MVRKISTFKLRDMARALKATKLAGVHAQIDILRDGTIRVTPIDGPKPVSDADEIVARLP